jgi:hypothetical protein
LSDGIFFAYQGTNHDGVQPGKICACGDYRKGRCGFARKAVTASCEDNEVSTAPSVQLSEMKPLLKGFGGTARLVERRALPRKLFRDRELRREVVVKAAGLGGASGLNVARRHGLVAHFPE